MLELFAGNGELTRQCRILATESRIRALSKLLKPALEFHSDFETAIPLVGNTLIQSQFYHVATKERMASNVAASIFLKIHFTI